MAINYLLEKKDFPAKKVQEFFNLSSQKKPAEMASYFSKIGILEKRENNKSFLSKKAEKLNKESLLWWASFGSQPITIS